MKMEDRKAVGLSNFEAANPAAVGKKHDYVKDRSRVRAGLECRIALEVTLR